MPGEAKPIPNEILFTLSQLLKGNQDTPEGRLKNVLLPQGMQKVIEDTSLGNKSALSDLLSASLDASDYVPGLGIIGAMTKKAQKRLLSVFNNPKVPQFYESWKGKPGSHEYFYKNPKILTDEMIDRMTPQEAFDALMRKTPASLNMRDRKTGEAVMTGVTNMGDAYEATHANAYEVFEDVRRSLEEAYPGTRDWNTDPEVLFGDDWSKRSDGFGVTTNSNEVYFANRKQMAHLTERATGMNLFKRDDGQAESIKLQRIKELIKEGIITPDDFLEINDVIEGRVSPYALDHIADRAKDKYERDRFLEFVGWIDPKRDY